MSAPLLPDDLGSMLKDLDRRLVALERSPQLTQSSIKDGALTIYNASGQPIIVLGKQSDNRYGLKVNNSAGTQVLRVGEQATGRYGLSSFDGSGNRIIDLGELASSRQGMEVYNTSGTTVARIGQQADNTYDVATIDSGGNYVKLSALGFGNAFDFISTAEGTTSTTFTNLATTGPTVNATVGSTGKVLVFFSAITTLSATGATGQFGVSVDGGAVSAASGFVHNFTAGSGGSGACAVRTISGLAAGSRQFRLLYRTTAGAVTATFENRSLLVLPI